MPRQADETRPAAGSGTGGAGMTWALATAVAGLGALVLFDAMPGINWVFWTAAAMTGLLTLERRRRRLPSSILLLGAVTVVIAGAAAFTASPLICVLICLAVIFLLAGQMLLTTSDTLLPVTAFSTAIAPLVAFRHAVVQAARHCVAATNLIRSTRAREWVRGLAITIPVLIGFALLLAGADPIFAGWRDAIAELIESWAFLPRVVFFVVLLVIVLGAYGYASVEQQGTPPVRGTVPARWFGATERFMLLGGVMALLWLFLALQLGYLFGNLPGTAASGVTFAEYARRGFAELSVVASASALLVIVSERHGSGDGREGSLRFITFALIAAVLLLLGSAFRRVLLYEEAYGFTTARLYAQFYMCAVAAGLVFLSVEVAAGFDAGRLFRRAAAAAMILFIALIYWNHESWIAGRNIDRYAISGKLDIAYLVKGLSPDAIPAIAERLPLLPEPVRNELRVAVTEHYAMRLDDLDRDWFEWNLAAQRARRVFEGGQFPAAGVVSP